MSEENRFAEQIKGIYYSLLPHQHDLSPRPEINTLLSRLVDLCTATHSKTFTCNVFQIKGIEQITAALRPLCGTAEGELESYWARVILTSCTGPVTASRKEELLHAFPYYQNYLDLSRLECSTLEAFLPPCGPECRPIPRKVAFIGSGPLPLTSFCILNRYPDANVYNVDRDSDALQISQTLSSQLGYGERMIFSCGDVSVEDALDGVVRSNGSGSSVGGYGRKNGAGKHLSWKDFDVVFLAALVGMDSAEKINILRPLVRRLRKGCLVVCRSAWGLRGVLYPTLELTDDLDKIGLEVLVVVHPWTKVVNSVVMLRVKE
ncbi:Nicotianamine synthase [Zopfia rhizophila CBS 207.26]|uniref:Nicotianamine synthase n=1 Tax=Zopfia rhizophila CBS 207.26 TaxID=1314779 RepID=A0A6A6E6Q4_9PEZI|nr:Nicotianamine synthase [Zopfia rhizophila CBS 207.26]